MRLEDEQNKLSSHIRQIAQVIYEAELRREDSLIQQGAQMQNTLSFTIIIQFVAAIVIKDRSLSSFDFFRLMLMLVTLIAMILALASLILAILVQRREEREDFMNIKETREFIQENYETISTDAARDLQYIKLIEKIQAEIRRTNDNKVILVQLSTEMFYCAIGLTVFWFVVALIKIKVGM